MKTESRTYTPGQAITFRKTNERFGGLSNMAPGFPVQIGEREIRTVEALYQACRFPHRSDLQELILRERSPMTAKMRSKPFRADSRPDWEAVRVPVMRWCLRLKLLQNWDRFRGLLLETGDSPIVEESRKDAFWGAQPQQDGSLIGRNVLGRLLMELREEIEELDEAPERLDPPDIQEFLLLGNPIGVVTRAGDLAPDRLVLFSGEPGRGEESVPAPPEQPAAANSGRNSLSHRKKLIEVALPLEAINRESAREKSIRHGHPSTVHLWWARRPLAACRAVLFASIVDDPSSRPEEFPTPEEQEVERQRLFRIIEELVKWDNSNDETVLEQARAEIMRATEGKPPPVLDPFCGGGSIPLEAQRLGLEAHASDLNPVAVLITKALIEIPPKFAEQPPANPEARQKLGHGATWEGARGLAEDVRYYGRWMRDAAFERIGDLYPKAKLSDAREATVIAWLWARTVNCPNPACGADMPLARSFALSTKKGKEWHVEPIVDGKSVRFEVRAGPASRDGTKQRGSAECLVCATTMNDATLRERSRNLGIGEQLMAVVVEADRQRIYMSSASEPSSFEDHKVDWLDVPLPDNARWFSPPGYGLTAYRDLFTPRQLLALTTFSDLVGEARECVVADGGSEEYASAIATYLAFAVDKTADRNTSLCTWESGMGRMRNTFGRQALPMVWDFAETNPFAGAGGDFLGTVESLCEVLDRLGETKPGLVQQLDAASAVNGVRHPVIATDPPYYDNIGYADLSDFFYVWLRRSLKDIYPNLFSTLLTPKSQELVATPYRFDGDRERADRFFEHGLRQAFDRMREAHHPEFPLTLFYAFKQAETVNGAVASTGWDTMLTGLLESGFAVTGTWPVRSELSNRAIASGTSALASSIVLVCRPRPAEAPIATRRELVNALRAELPEALRTLQHGSIAPVDLAQAAIGPGMAVFSRFAKVLEADGSAMTIRTALGLINHALDEILAEQEGDFDHETRFAVTWFEQRGIAEGPFGEADVLARAKDTSVDGMVEAGVLFSRAGKVRLLRRDEMPDDWDPVTDRRPTAWEAAQHLTRRLQTGGEAAAAGLLRRLGGGYGEQARELAYRLYSICERKGWAQEALPYNALVVAWPEIARRVAGTPEAEAQQALEV